MDGTTALPLRLSSSHPLPLPVPVVLSSSSSFLFFPTYTIFNFFPTPVQSSRAPLTLFLLWVFLGRSPTLASYPLLLNGDFRTPQ